MLTPQTIRKRNLPALKKSPESPKTHVHYKKLTKGKDLSSRSKTDLDCIFGKRQSKKIPKDDSSPATPDGNETSTVTSALTIQEYFAKQQAELKNKPQVMAVGPYVSETKGERKERQKINVENYTQLRTKKKRNQVEQRVRDPYWDENYDTSTEDGEGCVS